MYDATLKMHSYEQPTTQHLTNQITSNFIFLIISSALLALVSKRDSTSFVAILLTQQKLIKLKLILCVTVLRTKHMYRTIVTICVYFYDIGTIDLAVSRFVVLRHAQPTSIVKLKFAIMTAVEWDEVKRLAADFQRAQLSSTVQRQYGHLLRSRTCVTV